MVIIDIKQNYKNKSCKMCYDNAENLQLLIDCTVYNLDPQRDVGVSKIFISDHV